MGFEVEVSQADSLEIGDVLQQADRFDFSGGRDPQSHDAYFSARSKDRKLLIQFDTESSHPFLTRVVYSY